MTCTEGDFEYVKIADGTAAITKYRGNARTLEIPVTLGGRLVTCICEGAFSECRTLTRINIPGCVTGLGSDALRLCENPPGVPFSEVIENFYRSTFDNNDSIPSVPGQGPKCD